MKICWDNLERTVYRPDRTQWKDKKYSNIFYVYKESCKNCGDPFLALERNKGKFCSVSCATSGKNNPLYNKKHSEETKKKMGGQNSYLWKGGVTKKNLPLYDTFALQISFCEDIRRNKQNQNILEVKCTYCGKWFIPTRREVVNRVQSLERKYLGENRLYCSSNCKQECSIYKKSKYPKGFKPATSREVQPQLRQLVFGRDGYICQKCGKTGDEIQIHCHHIDPVANNPIESADIDNCVTLCKDCHKEVHKQTGCGYYELKCKEVKNG